MKVAIKFLTFVAPINGMHYADAAKVKQTRNLASAAAAMGLEEDHYGGSRALYGSQRSSKRSKSKSGGSSDDRKDNKANDAVANLVCEAFKDDVELNNDLCGKTFGDTNLRMTRNVHCSGDGPILNANTSLDCDGHTISGDFSPGLSDDLGVTLSDGAMLTNCIIEGFDFCVGSTTTEGPNIINNVIVTSCDYGIDLFEGKHHLTNVGLYKNLGNIFGSDSAKISLDGVTACLGDATEFGGGDLVASVGQAIIEHAKDVVCDPIVENNTDFESLCTSTFISNAERSPCDCTLLWS